MSTLDFLKTFRGADSLSHACTWSSVAEKNTSFGDFLQASFPKPTAC